MDLNFAVALLVFIFDHAVLLLLVFVSVVLHGCSPKKIISNPNLFYGCLLRTSCAIGTLTKDVNLLFPALFGDTDMFRSFFGDKDRFQESTVLNKLFSICFANNYGAAYFQLSMLSLYTYSLANYDRLNTTVKKREGYLALLICFMNLAIDVLIAVSPVYFEEVDGDFIIRTESSWMNVVVVILFVSTFLKFAIMACFLCRSCCKPSGFNLAEQAKKNLCISMFLVIVANALGLLIIIVIRCSLVFEPMKFLLHPAWSFLPSVSSFISGSHSISILYTSSQVKKKLKLLLMRCCPCFGTNGVAPVTVVKPSSTPQAT